LLVASFAIALAGCLEYPPSVQTNPAVKSQQWPRIAYNTKGGWNSRTLYSSGKEIFRFDTCFYHDGRFATLDEVVDHYDAHLKLDLTPQEKRDLVEYLKSL